MFCFCHWDFSFFCQYTLTEIDNYRTWLSLSFFSCCFWDLCGWIHSYEYVLMLLLLLWQFYPICVFLSISFLWQLNTASNFGHLCFETGKLFPQQAASSLHRKEGVSQGCLLIAVRHVLCLPLLIAVSSRLYFLSVKIPFGPHATHGT